MSDKPIEIKITPSFKGTPKYQKTDPRVFFLGATIITNEITTNNEDGSLCISRVAVE